MIQERVDDLREWLAGRHQAKAQRHVRLRDFWRWQVQRPWLELFPAWVPWVALAVFWAVIAWLVFW